MTVWLMAWLMDWMVDWLVGWWTVWLMDWLVDGLTDGPTEWWTAKRTGCLKDWQVDWLVDALTDGQLTPWLTNWLTDWKTNGLIEWVTDLWCHFYCGISIVHSIYIWLDDQMTDWWTGRLTGWMTDLMTDHLMDRWVTTGYLPIFFGLLHFRIMSMLCIIHVYLQLESIWVSTQCILGKNICKSYQRYAVFSIPPPLPWNSSTPWAYESYEKAIYVCV